MVQTKAVLGLCLKLIVISFIMGHALTFVENTRDDVWRCLLNPPIELYGAKTSSRWLNKQVKFLMSTVHVTLMSQVLAKIQNMLHGSDKTLRAATFASILTIAMAAESIQIAIWCRDSTDRRINGIIDQDGDRVRGIVALMDERMDFLCRLFHQKHKSLRMNRYHPSPRSGAPGQLDASAQEFVQRVNRLVNDKRKSELLNFHHLEIGMLTCLSDDILTDRSNLPPPSSFADLNTSRLVAKFLLLVCNP